MVTSTVCSSTSTSQVQVQIQVLQNCTRVQVQVPSTTSLVISNEMQLSKFQIFKGK